MQDIVLQTRGLSKCYGHQEVVSEVALSVPVGGVYGLVGLNGAGKTTLMRMVAGLTRPSAGSIDLMGQSDSQGLSWARSHMGCIVETPQFFNTLTAHQNLEYYRIQRGIANKGSVDESLAIVGLDAPELARKKFKGFSLGMKQRLGMALALLGNPSFIMLDEPINGLDPQGVRDVRNIIRTKVAQGTTFLISSHILAELDQVATSFGFIHKGRLLLEISAAQLHEACKIALELSVGDTAQAARIVEQELRITPGAYKVTGPHNLRIYGQLHEPAVVNATLTAGGVQVQGMAQVGESLEDYFTNLLASADGQTSRSYPQPDRASIGGNHA
jgi:ABC-2 type transport system ATP-binding protein